MPDLNRMDRTWLCTVVFTDIAKYSSQSVELQMKLKARFNGYLAHAIRDTPEDERVILDTGDGAAICFLGAPEAAMFAALELWHSLLHDEREQPTPLRVRIGINLGPVKLVKDINGALNAIGDGMNAGQRIMSFAAENQILVSQSFFEVVSRLSDDYKDLFKLKGVETDKHVREHTVYKLLPPGGDKTQAFAVAANLEMKPLPEPVVVASASQNVPGKAQESKTGAGSRSTPLLIGGIAVLVIAAAGAWYFFGPIGHATQATPAPNPTSAQQPPTQQPMTAASPAAAPSTNDPTAASPSSPPVTPAGPSPSPNKSAPAVTASNPPAKQPPAPVISVAKENPTPAVTPVAAAPSDPNAPYNAAYAEGVRLLDEDKAAEAVRHFDDAIRAKPDFIEAYVFRAEARRNLAQYEMSLEDCNKIIQIKPDEPRGYNCRGLSRQMLKQFDASLPDFAEAIRRNPSFAIAYANRGTHLQSDAAI
jgi:class 3 adenylate cyclase